MTVTAARLLIPCCLLTTYQLSALESQQYLRGDMLVEAVHQNNYTDGESDVSDRSHQMWIRSRFGAKLELEDSVEVQFTMVYDAEGGDSNTRDNADARSELEVNDAFVLLKGFLNEGLHVRVGRQPVSLNLRSDYGAMLFDSRSHSSFESPRPTVTSWDGITAFWQLETMKFIPWYYIMDEVNESSGTVPASGRSSEANTLLGVTFDWKPDANGDDRIFLSGTASLESNPYVGDAIQGIDIGEELTTYSLGGTFLMRGGVEVFVEGAIQDGEVNGDVDFAGVGISGGAVWRPRGDRDAVITLQYDYFSGDDNPDDDEYKGFVNTYEGMADTLIVENERYGELSELLVGNMESFKAKFEWGFFDNRFAMKFMGAIYKMKEEVGGEDDFGIEYDIEFDFQYNDFTTFSIFGGAFLPGDGYEAVTDAIYGGNNGDSAITLFGINTQVLF